MSAFWAEVIGTMVLIVLGGGVCAGVNLKKSFAEGSGWIVITFGWGLGVAMAVYATGQISGGHFNPAVTLALALTGDFPWADVPLYLIAQMIGAFLGAVIVYLHYLPHWRATEDPAVKLGVFSTGPAIPNVFANFLSEVIGTFILITGILSFGGNKFTDGLNPLIVGFLVVAIGLSLGGTTGYAINPARDLGPRIAHFVLPIAGKGTSNWSYAWIPVAGPLAGGAFAAVFYQAAFKGTIGPSFWIVSVLLIVILVAVFAADRKNAASRMKSPVYKKNA
ncbi:aquaporin family protein [Metabacillus sp. GX 13764]|uniref:MIP/aquaporin family protein n=1 Tax=Metabacillus kandeliae TaxID=2900151 RepID=UPI001E33CF70|nr:MIP/aquaporin family protein [Metabacillus kandeliae]MCD7035202.1 aquaporin family protein [Metabacillus kandeliae]